MAEILPIRRKTLCNQSINQSNQTGSEPSFFLKHCKKISRCIKNYNVNVPIVAIFKVIRYLRLPITRDSTYDIRVKIEQFFFCNKKVEISLNID